MNQSGYIKRSDYHEKLDQMFQLLDSSDRLNKRVVILSNSDIEAFKDLFIEFYYEVIAFESRIEEHNSRYLTTVIENTRSVVGDIEGHRLDDQQIMCIAKNAHNHNVIAGAGTGKTTTIIGKVKYLVSTRKYLPEEILVLSYTRAAATEMKQRLRQNVSADIYVSTFHHFGYYVVSTVEKHRPTVVSKNLNQILYTELKNLLHDSFYQHKLIRFLGYGTGQGKTDLDSSFSGIEDYIDYISTHRPVTFKGELVKSYGEMHLANILSENGIRYTYEKRYEFDTSNKDFAQYTPDFYLDDYGIYIEYFGISFYNVAGIIKRTFKINSCRLHYTQIESDEGRDYIVNPHHSEIEVLRKLSAEQYEVSVKQDNGRNSKSFIAEMEMTSNIMSGDFWCSIKCNGEWLKYNPSKSAPTNVLSNRNYLDILEYHVYYKSTENLKKTMLDGLGPESERGDVIAVLPFQEKYFNKELANLDKGKPVLISINMSNPKRNKKKEKTLNGNILILKVNNKYYRCRLAGEPFRIEWQLNDLKPRLNIFAKKVYDFLEITSINSLRIENLSQQYDLMYSGEMAGKNDGSGYIFIKKTTIT